MSSTAQEYYVSPPAIGLESFEATDNSLLHTVECGVALAGNIGRSVLGRAVPWINQNGQLKSGYCPARYVELNPDVTHVVTTEFGSTHTVDIYNPEYLGTERSDTAPVVMTMELGCPSDRGFKSPIIKALGECCRKQSTALMVVSSEGFAGTLTAQQLWNLDFDIIVDNVQDAIDAVEEREDVRIPELQATGGSRGGTTTLLLGTKEARERRDIAGKPDRAVTNMVAVAPAGLRPPDFAKRWRMARQFLASEPAHMIRKASTMQDEELLDYGHSLFETRPDPGAMSAVAKTALLFMLTAPLENIGERIGGGASVSILTMDSDGVTMPRHWKTELKDHCPVVISSIPGNHLSIDSLRKVFAFTAFHLRA